MVCLATWIAWQLLIATVHDWSLRKGDPPIERRQNGPQIESTTIHSIVSESGDERNTKIVVEADISRKDLSPLVQGHEVDGIPLCTPSVYADMALTLGTYLLKRYHPNQSEMLVDVSDMTISKALILNDESKKQLVQVHAEADWSSRTVNMRFMSFNNHHKLQEHSRCVVLYKDFTLRQQLQNRASDVKAKISELREGIATGKTARYNRAMVYRAIRPLARFHNDYRAIDEIVLNSDTLEACSTLSFGSVKRDGDYHTHPAIIDSLTQACGFTMNCNDSTDLDVEVFMNHGWSSLQLFEPMDFEKVYTTYSRMESGPDKLWRGDATIFDGDKVVAYFGQIAIQGVPRRVLKVILSLESGKKAQTGNASTQRPVANVDQKQAASAAAHVSPTARQGPNSMDVGLRIIAEESGVAIEGFTDDACFADMGVDSLLGLTISARFREQLDIDLDFNGLFFEYPTVKDLKVFLGESLPDSGYVSPTSNSTVGSESARTDKNNPTPNRSLGGSMDRSATPESIEASPSSNVDLTRALQIIAEETGVETSQLDDEAELADCGVDSLLSLIITSRFRNELDLELESEALFLEHPTVGKLKRTLMGKPDHDVGAPAVLEPAQECILEAPVDGNDSLAEEAKSTSSGSTLLEDRVIESEAALTARKSAVDKLVEEFTAGFVAPSCVETAPATSNDKKVVLVTGGTGSLGGHLVYHLSQQPDVQTVVCLNRKHRDDPVLRQLQAMRDKGIRFPEDLKSKLLVLQTDSSLPQLGLDQEQYDALTASVTHLVHQAWPMSATRPLSGFKAQFDVMRHLVEFARDAASQHRASFRFSFELVSSIGVVGLYDRHLNAPKTIVPEASATIASVLPNGYSEAKWGCERMLDHTLHSYPTRFRAMVSRLGQIAGSKTSGYWNPMEHFGFLIKSSCTIDALPSVPGNLYWTPVNDVAHTLSDLLLAANTPHPVYHVDHPTGQSWEKMTPLLQSLLHITQTLPFPEWLARVRAHPQKNNPALLLADFLEHNYLRMSCGGLVLDVSNSLEHSECLRGLEPVEDRVVGKYVHIWKEIGFLDASEGEKRGFEERRNVLWG